MSAFALAAGQTVWCEAGSAPGVPGLISCLLAGWAGIALGSLRSASAHWVLKRLRLPGPSRGTVT
ncbi:MAG: hypothetical protein ACK5O3_13565 [Burkholderiales bacterium]